VEYGKKITTESYFKGQLKSTKVEYQIPEMVMDDAQALTEFMKGLTLIRNKETAKLHVTVDADPKTFFLKSVTCRYEVDDN